MSSLVNRLNAALQGRYLVERQLGEGGMATVYLATDVRHDRRVALKVLKPELAAAVGAERFLAEIRTTANLQHPHILPLFDSGQADGMLFYVMPYVEGESLRERLDRERQLPVDEAVRIATNVAEALDYAHARGVIHRDIKPANILLQSGKPVVSDFGIALAVSAGGEGRLTETGLSLGTPHYMSPEQATGDIRVGVPTDIYALGCVLYEMLVGEPPYTGSTPQAILGKILAGEGVSATKLRSTIPPHVDSVIRKALEKVPADRFASASELASALDEPGFRHATLEPRGGVAAASRGRGAVLALAGAVVGAVIAALFMAGDASEPDPSLMRFPLLEAGSVVRRAGIPPDLAIAPDGRVVAYVGSTPDGTGQQLHLRALDEVAAVPLAGTEGALSPSFSPDGRWIAFIDVDQQAALKRVAVTGGASETIAVLDSVNYIAGVTWEDSDRLIVGTGSGTGLYRVTVGGTVQRLAQGQFHWPTYIAGRDAVVFMDHDSSRLHLGALDLRNGEVASLGVEGTAPRYLPGGHLVFVRPDGRLAAARFDAASLALVGEPVTLPEVIDLKTPEGAGNFDVSPEGTLVFAPGGFGVGRGTRLMQIARDGRDSAVAVLDGDVAYPRVSPDGEKVAVAIGQDLWVVDLMRGAPSRITYAGNNRFLPLWTPDGSGLTHALGVDPENRVVLTAADGSGRQDTLIALGPRTFPTSWSPEGRTLALTAGQTGRPRDIRLLVNDGASSEVVPFVETAFSERGAVFSPDGRWVAYVSDKSGGRDEIYVRPISGSGAEVTVSLDGGGEPVWSRSGSELFYRGSSAFFVVSIASTASGLSVGRPRMLFTDSYPRDNSGIAAYANYDVMPNGELLVVADAERPTSPGIQIAVGWMNELRTRLPE